MTSFWTWEAGKCKDKRCLWASKEVCLLQAPLTALLTTSGLSPAELLAKLFDDFVGVEEFCSTSLNTVIRKKYRNDKWHNECPYTFHSDYYENIISSILSCERRKKGKVLTNCNVFDRYQCVITQLAKAPMFIECLRQEMIACVATRNSDDETQILTVSFSLLQQGLRRSRMFPLHHVVILPMLLLQHQPILLCVVTARRQHPSVTTHRLLWSPLKQKDNLFRRPDQLKGIFHA